MVDTRVTDLLPAEVAMRMFDKHGFGAWARSPKLMKEILCGGDWVPVKFEDIDFATYSSTAGKLRLGRSFGRGSVCGQVVTFNVATEQGANDLTKAAVALGARIEKLTIVKGSVI